MNENIINKKPFFSGYKIVARSLNLINEEIILTSSNKHVAYIDADPERYIRFYANTHPYSLLIIDHIDHLTFRTVKKLISFLNELPIQIIISSRYSYKFISVKQTYFVPPLLKSDIEDLIHEIGSYKYKSKIYKSKTYISVLRNIYSQDYKLSHIDKIDNIKKARQAVAISGGFINQSLFEEVFSLEHKSIEQLKKTGLIIFNEGFYYPHDAIYDSDYEEDLKQLCYVACTYWEHEINNDPKQFKAIHNYIILIFNFNVKYNDKNNELYKVMINAMQGRHNTYFLIVLYEYLKVRMIPLKLRIFLCEILIDVGKINEAKNLIINYQYKDKRLSALHAELLWWQGKFFECIELSTNLLLDNVTRKTRSHLLCSRGIGYFFIGQWEKASEDLQIIVSNQNTSNEKSKFLSFCVLATIQGLRGFDFKKSTENFIEAMNVAKKAGKLSWLILIYGNMGEILWKAGFYAKSIEILETSSHLAYLADNAPIYSEINRNLLHVYQRNQQGADAKEQLNKLESIFNEQSDNYVKMQMVNTLITHYIFLGNSKYRQYLAMAKKLTLYNDEYQIYTYSNIALSKLLSYKMSLAIVNMEKALNLCLIGKNWLAIKQCLDDWDETLISNHVVLPDSKEIFQKWHQILERELLPYLHHLERLFEYLESPYT